ncbi:MAG: hypothetical protein ACREQN_10555 [Candidatus Binataceae bacterium]
MPPKIGATLSLRDSSFMDAAEKGRRYAKVFRKAGVLLGKGRIARAVEVLKQGQTLAEAAGDRTMARHFAAEIDRALNPAAPSD